MRRSERGFTLVEIMIVVAIIALLAAIAIPNVLRGRATANESAAIGNVHANVSALEMYRASQSVYPTPGTGWLAAMVTTAQPPFAPAAFIAVDIGVAGGGTLQGFTYQYASAGAQVYTLTAWPANQNTGSRSFFADETGVVRHCNCPVAAPGCTTAVNAKVANPTLDAAPVTCA